MKIQGTPATPRMAPTQARTTARSESSAVAETGQVYSGSKADRARKIMAGQDLTHMSQNELNALGKRLYREGAITGEQMLDLTAPHYMLKDANFNDIGTWDDKRNVMADIKGQLEPAGV